jgi:hypothetical protein
VINSPFPVVFSSLQFYLTDPELIQIRYVLLLNGLPTVEEPSPSHSPVPNETTTQLLHEDQLSTRSRTITIWNIPPHRTLETITASFSSFGAIESTKCQDQNDASRWNMSLVFIHRESALRAASSLHEGLLVRLASSTNSARLNHRPKAVVPNAEREVVELEEDDCFEATEAHAFEDYRPVHSLGGTNHPGHLVQSASLSSVDPPPITYKLTLPDYVRLFTSQKSSFIQPLPSRRLSRMDCFLLPSSKPSHMLASNMISSLALALAEVSVRFQHTLTDTPGYFIGDGAGVGKGRQLAGIIFENWIRGRKKHVWFSVSSNLELAARQDLVRSPSSLPPT